MSSDTGPTDPLRDLLADGVEVEGDVIEFGELALLLGPDLLAQLSQVLDSVIPQGYQPPRGSEEYRDLLEEGAHVSNMPELLDGIGILWGAYGWKAIVDFQEVLIRQIVHLSVPVVQDNFGRTRLDKLVAVEPDDVTLMTTAVNIVNDPDMAPRGLDFTRAYEMGKAMAERNREWFAVFQKALDACVQGQSAQVWAILARLPGLKDGGIRVKEGTTALALAALCLRDPAATAANMLDAGVPKSEFDPAVLRRAQAHQRKQGG